MEKKEEIKEYFLGTSKGAYEAEEAFGLTDIEVLDLIIEAEIECCSSCNWWYEAGEMEEVDCELLCPDCFKEPE
jgi:hypothetical protein